MADKIKKNSPKKVLETQMASIDLVRVCETLEYSHTVNEDRGKIIAIPLKL